MSLKSELKKMIADVLSKEGMPPCIDKTFLDMWTNFAKTQPTPLNTTAKVDPDVWGSLKLNLMKFAMKEPLADKVIKKATAKFGETPSVTEVKAFMS